MDVCVWTGNQDWSTPANTQILAYNFCKYYIYIEYCITLGKKMCDRTHLKNNVCHTKHYRNAGVSYFVYRWINFDSQENNSTNWGLFSSHCLHYGNDLYDKNCSLNVFYHHLHLFLPRFIEHHISIV